MVKTCWVNVMRRDASDSRRATICTPAGDAASGFATAISSSAITGAVADRVTQRSLIRSDVNWLLTFQKTMLIYFCSSQFNPLAAGKTRARWHLEPVPVVLSHSRAACQPATDTDSRCFFHVSRSNIRSGKIERRAEPLERPCSFALPGLFTWGTLQVYVGWRTWGTTDPTSIIPPTVNAIYTYAIRGYAPRNKGMFQVKWLNSVVQSIAEPAGRGDARDGPQAENAAEWKPQSAPKAREPLSPNPFLLGGLGEVFA